MEKTRTIRGEIVLPTTELPDKAEQVIVQVEDISRADAPSVVHGEQRRRAVRLRGGATIPFVVKVPASRLDDRGLYSVRAHVDMTGSGDVTSGDLVSTQTHPVLTRGYGDQVRIPVRRV